jgi:hypothetical protein
MVIIEVEGALFSIIKDKILFEFVIMLYPVDLFLINCCTLTSN